jgi:hypothetical protein
MRHTITAWGIALCLSAAATAQPYGGTVYGVYPEGVMINQGGTSYLVPTEHATFEVGGLRASWTSLQPGQFVNAVMPPIYYPNIQRIPDPYAWKVKYHPDHPHGGPPGQMKKAYPNNGNGNGKGKGNGKGR